MSVKLKLPQYVGGERLALDAPTESLNPSDTRDVVALAPEAGQGDRGDR
jgi:hypothetical protein